MTLIGFCPTNEVGDFRRATKFLGRRPDLVNLFFDQRAGMLPGSWSWQVKRNREFYQAGATRVLWSVPCPGAGQLEAIVAGRHDAMYEAMAQAILAAVTEFRDARARIRLFWEQNFAWQENAARAKDGSWSPSLYVQAFEHVAAIFLRVLGKARSGGDLAYIIWCPNVGVYDCDPASTLPGRSFFHCVGQDFYLQARYDRTGFFGYFRDRACGLAWGRQLATSLNRDYALPEWGMDDDRFLPDFYAARDWIGANNLHHHGWWDRTDGGVDSTITVGAPSRSKIAAAYREAFA
ncbi:hypothetical protein [Sphingomonas sp. BK235]|uniref:hypothetical protein n=1 Tax=Sphingomonas sp. BK235 TaxID=2512131 RepID=UPI001054059D|nr:hypothetical protein [Sphingomonas sp. BK235]TCP36562.1 hypothetical protein EV292_10158 [Sphingomonas sp. BK235]